jgi:hypothetical protein
LRRLLRLRNLPFGVGRTLRLRLGARRRGERQRGEEGQDGRTTEVSLH